MVKSRLVYAGWVAVVIVTGLVSRSARVGFLPDFVKDYAGDTLWALMVFLILGFIFPQARILTVSAAALAISFAVEFSQIYQADWINGMRSTRIGGLVLGRGWVPTDLICYAVGVAIGASGEILKCRIFEGREPQMDAGGRR